MAAIFFVDAGHLLAAAGRALGIGPVRSQQRFDTPKLVAAIRSLDPDGDASNVRWYDGVLPSGSAADHAELAPVPGVEVITMPMRGRRQQHIQALMLRDVMALGAAADRVYLVGDPRRHAVTLRTAADERMKVRVVGVSGAERAPAVRLWLRRGELMSAQRRLSPKQRHDAERIYTPPRALAERIPESPRHDVPGHV